MNQRIGTNTNSGTLLGPEFVPFKVTWAALLAHHVTQNNFFPSVGIGHQNAHPLEI